MDTNEILNMITEDCPTEGVIETYSFIEIDCSDQEDEVYNTENFKKGIEDYSYVCGAITALCNAGLNPTEAIEYIVNQDTIKHNIEVSKIGAEATVRAAKYASVKSELENL